MPADKRALTLAELRKAAREVYGKNARVESHYLADDYRITVREQAFQTETIQVWSHHQKTAIRMALAALEAAR